MQILAGVGGPAAPTSVEYVVVGPGGAGGPNARGGGSGGEVFTGTVAVTGNTEYTVTVGAGATWLGNLARSTNVSSFNTVTATAGQDGGDPAGGAGRNGGGNGGAYGAGGGVAGSAGTASSITGSSVTYAGGGGGGSGTSTSASGGAGGGGAGGRTTATSGTPGAANTGGGGGGSSASGGSVFGGSGIVIIAYSQNFAIAAATTGSPTLSTVSRPGFYVYTFTGSGSITF